MVSRWLTDGEGNYLNTVVESPSNALVTEPSTRFTKNVLVVWVDIVCVPWWLTDLFNPLLFLDGGGLYCDRDLKVCERTLFRESLSRWCSEVFITF